MTLREKFENNIIGINGEIKISDDYAIEFAEWVINNGVEFYDNTSKGNVYKYISDLKVYTIKELLEIFKKEKGL